MDVRISGVYVFHSVCKMMLSGGVMFILFVVSVGCVTTMIAQKCRNVRGGCEVSAFHPVILLSAVDTTRQSFSWVHVR